MKVKIYSVDCDYSNGKLKKHYIEKLKKYKIREIIYEEHGYTRYGYYITLNDIKDIFNIVKELGQQLIIDSDTITIYDDYIE